MQYCTVLTARSNTILKRNHSVGVTLQWMDAQLIRTGQQAHAVTPNQLNNSLAGLDLLLVNGITASRLEPTQPGVPL